MANVKVNLSAFNSYVSRVVQPFLVQKAEEIARIARQEAPKSSGDLANSITVERGPKGSAVVRVHSPHAGYVHQGTGPHHTPSPRAPYYPRVSAGLLRWAMTKGLNPYAVAKGISTAGTPANPFLETAIEQVLGKYKFKWIRKDLNT